MLTKNMEAGYNTKHYISFFLYLRLISQLIINNHRWDAKDLWFEL